jgi:hypothetical protein
MLVEYTIGPKHKHAFRVDKTANRLYLCEYLEPRARYQEETQCNGSLRGGALRAHLERSYSVSCLRLLRMIIAERDIRCTRVMVNEKREKRMVATLNEIAEWKRLDGGQYSISATWRGNVVGFLGKLGRSLEVDLYTSVARFFLGSLVFFLAP